jgi:hypothetical protein
MRMFVLHVDTWLRGDAPGLGLTNEDSSILREVDCDILTQDLIGLIDQSASRPPCGFCRIDDQQLDI